LLLSQQLLQVICKPGLSFGLFSQLVDMCSMAAQHLRQLQCMLVSMLLQHYSLNLDAGRQEASDGTAVTANFSTGAGLTTFQFENCAYKPVHLLINTNHIYNSQ
jgi:hypothetical protein